tara:strand:- start:379 stop:594 length:216 start_codon:yes stop_codon:yes gene_type:complete
MSLFLAAEEIELLTGYKQIGKQQQELRKKGIPFITRHDGFPVVTTKFFENLETIGSKNSNTIETPNFDDLS